MLISSRKNAAVARYRNLVKDKAFRAETEEFPIEGARLCIEAVRSGLELTAFFATEAASRKYPEAFREIADEIDPIMISEDVSSFISDTKSPQGIFLSAKTLDKTPELSKIEKGGRYLILDGLQDTGNIGTIIRTCDAFGMDGVILSPDCADIYSPKIVRGAMGSLFRLPVFRTELVPLIKDMKKSGYSVYAALLDNSSEQLQRIEFGKKTAIIIGNEGNGVTPDVYNAAGQKLYIPINNAESLNAAVAASVICWEICRKDKQ